MIKKIFSWTLGSFFRTLGRFAFYIIIGLLLSYILQGVNIKGLFNVLDVYADTYEVSCRSTGYGYLTNEQNTPVQYCSYGNLLGVPVLSTYNVNQTYNCGTTNYGRFPIQFTTKPETGYYNISGQFTVRNLNRYISSINWLTTNTACDIDYKPNDSSEFIKFTCKNVYIDSQYFNIQASFSGGASCTYFPNFGRYLNLEKTLNSVLEDDNVNESTNTASNFFNNFNTDTHGLTGIITAPLSAINSLTNSTCTPLELPLPFVNDDLTLPCMRQIYDDNFGDFMILYDIITLGIISYWVMVRIFGLVKDFKNPEHDEVEVLDL